jgi:adenosylhomocysteine nucleosidase
MVRARLLIVAVFSAFAVAPAFAQSPDPRPPLLVQGAMTVEVEKLAGRLEGAVVDRVGPWIFWRGTLDGYPVIVSKTLKGIANASAATVLAVERYHPAAIINQGTAGGHDPALKLYDIVVGTSAVYIGAFRSPYRAAGSGSNPLEWVPLNLGASDGSAGTDPAARKIARFQSDARLLDAARRAKARYTRARIVEGVIGTSDMWNDEIDLIARFHNEYGTEVEEMETASAAQIAALFGVPFLGIRVVSDNTTNGTAYDPKTSEACEDYVHEVAKAYIALLRR